LYDNTRMSIQELKELTGLDYADLNNHIQRLKRKNLLITEQGFEDGSIRTFVQLQPAAAAQFKQLKSMLVEFLSNAPNLDRYIEQALEIQNKTKQEELYPLDN